MLCYAILYYTILCYTILCYTILYYAILYYTILYYTILYYTILYYTILYYTILIGCLWVFCWTFYLVFGLHLPALLSDSYLAYSNIFQHFFALLRFLNKLAISRILFGMVFGSGAPRACELTVVCGSALPRENLRAGVAVPARACHVKRRWTSQSATPARCSYMSPSATPATQKAAASTATAGNRARHQSQPSAIRATPAT